jgi:hypothetical protein
LLDQPNRAGIDTLEAKSLQGKKEEEEEQLLGNLLGVRLSLESELGSALSIFCEPVLGSSWDRQLDWADRAGPRAGLKLRCGGLSATAFPSTEIVAAVIAQCRDRRIKWKATAGLHHPLRHFDPALQTHMHGFINLFTAGVLALARGLSIEQIREIIEDEDPAHFHFDDAGLRWRDVSATMAETTNARGNFATSFGSCSFDEPRDDLRALGWLKCG